MRGHYSVVGTVSEPAWFWLKRRTTAQGAPANRKAMEQAWYRAWRELPQEQIQQWISAIPHHFKEVVRLEGENEYPMRGPFWHPPRL